MNARCPDCGHHGGRHSESCVPPNQEADMNRKQSAWLLAGLARDEGTVVVLDAVDLDDPNLHAEVAADWRIGRRLLAMADDEAVLLEVEPWAILRRYRYRGD